MVVIDIHSTCSLYTGWVQHDTGLSTDRLRREISSESASDDTVGSMCPAHLTPVDSEFVSVFISNISLRDESDTLSQVEINFFLGIDTSDLQQTNVTVLGSKSTLVSEDSGINVKARGSLLRHD